MCEILCHCVKHCFPVWSIVPLCKILGPSVKYVSLCQILCHCVKYCSSVKHLPLCQIFCPYMKYCVPVSNILPLCLILCICVKYCAIVSNIMSLCQMLCHCVKHVSSPSSSSLPRAVQRRERVADAKVPASNRTLILDNFTWAEKYFTEMSFVTFVKNSTSVADNPAINRTC